VPKGLAGILRDVCGLRESDVIDREVIARILQSASDRAGN